MEGNEDNQLTKSGTTRKKPSGGPKTEMGRLKMAISKIKTGQHSTLVKKFRVCDKCPLGPSTETKILRGREAVIKYPAQCKHHVVGNKKCPIGITTYRDCLQVMFDMMEDEPFEVAVAKTVSMHAMQDAIMSRDIETLKKGHPGFYTKEFGNLAIDAAEKAHRMKHGDKATIIDIKTTPEEVAARIKAMKEEERD